MKTGTKLVVQIAECCGSRFKRWRFVDGQFPDGRTRCHKCEGSLIWRFKCGTNGLSPELKDRMVADYTRLQSIKAVALLYGKKHQTVRKILIRHGALLKPKAKNEKRVYKGRTYFLNPARNCFYDHGRDQWLHHVIWSEHNGAVPEGHVVIFKDKNKRNFAPDNLQCVPFGEHVAPALKGTHYRYRAPKEIVAYMKFRESLNVQMPASFLSNFARAEA